MKSQADNSQPFPSLIVYYFMQIVIVLKNMALVTCVSEN